MTGCCPHCGQSLPADRVESEAEAIREWCNDNGIPLLLGDHLRQSDVARYLGLTSKTLSNWGSGWIPQRRMHGRVYFSVKDVAWHIVENLR